MGTCLCEPNHITEAHYEQNAIKEQIQQTVPDNQDNTNTNNNKNDKSDKNINANNNQSYNNVNTNICNNSTRNFSPELKRERSPYSTFGQSSLSLSFKGRPILSRLKNKSKSSSSLIHCEKK